MVGAGRRARTRLARPELRARPGRVHAQGDGRLPLARALRAAARGDHARPRAATAGARLRREGSCRRLARPTLQHRLLAASRARAGAPPRDLRVPPRAHPVARGSGHRPRHVSVPRDRHRAQHEARLRQAAGETVTENDPLIRQLREQISDNDRAIVEAINARLKLVARLKGYKESRGLSFVDPDREQWMLQYLARANRGPLSSDGLQELFEQILALTKREVDRAEG